jgi:hypothetical protein
MLAALGNHVKRRMAVDWPSRRVMLSQSGNHGTRRDLSVPRRHRRKAWKNLVFLLAICPALVDTREIRWLASSFSICGIHHDDSLRDRGSDVTDSHHGVASGADDLYLGRWRIREF